jgi:gamma-glutamyltranspeptidase/glutathione hydrolase
MMAPTIATHHEGARIVGLGSGGANRIRSAVTRVLEAHLREGLGMLGAVSAPRVHAEGDSVWFERAGWREPVAVETALRANFERVVPFESPAFFFGGVHSVSHDGRSSQGAGDARRGGLSLTVLRPTSSD